MEIVVAVCAELAPPSLQTTVDALLEQGARVVVALSEPAAGRARAPASVEVLRVSQPGIAAARNAALAGCAGDVLALLDAGLVVEPNWLAALEAAWAAAAGDVAAIGGPVGVVPASAGASALGGVEYGPR